MWRPAVHALLLVLLTITTLHTSTLTARAREFDIEGTIDCGKPTGKICIPIGRQVGVLTESMSGKREHVKIDLSWMLDRPVRRRGSQQELVTEGHHVSRGLLFQQFRERVDALEAEGIPTDRLSADDARAIVRELVVQSVEINTDVIRQNLGFIVTHLKQDAAVTITVRDDGAQPYLATTFQDRFEFSSDTSEGTLNTGSLTGSDPDKDLCFDVVNELLDWAREKLEEQGNLELNDLEERFFKVLSDVPNPCIGYEDNVEAIITDRATRTLQAKRTNLNQRLRTFLDRNPDFRRKLRAFVFLTILNEQGGGDERVREITERIRESRP
jgi:hypothetical protein